MVKPVTYEHYKTIIYKVQCPAQLLTSKQFDNKFIAHIFRYDCSTNKTTQNYLLDTLNELDNLPTSDSAGVFVATLTHRQLLTYL